MRALHVLFCFLFAGILQANAQMLIVNEVSQGSGTQEYVEFIVAGTPSCQTPAPCADLRGVVIDDNNGTFASGSGVGIAAGAVRFANNAFWSCIPQGTLIVVYNDNDRNGAIPPDDLSMSDGNCRLIVPISSSLFEGQSTSPNSSNTAYPPNGSWIAGAGNWSQVAMANGGDSFLIMANITASPYHAVSWGSNNAATFIYFSGSASGKVFSLTGNNPLTQGNWTSGNVGTDETPGNPNSTANSAWIASMNPQCGVSSGGLQATASATPTGCGPSCNGTANVTISGGSAPYTILWSNGTTTANISNLCAGIYTVQVTDNGGCSISAQATVTNGASSINVSVSSSNETCAGACDGSLTGTPSGGTAPYSYLWSDNSTLTTISNKCPGTYSVTVTDQNGCSGTASGTIAAGSPIPDATIQTTGPFSTTDSPIQFVANSTGGTWSSDCGTCISASGLFNPANAGAGTYQVCYSVGSGACTDQDCKTIAVTGCTPQTTSESHSMCPGDTYTFNGQTLTDAGAYPVVFTGQNGCDSTHTLNLSIFTVTPTSQTLTPCQGDSVLIEGTWYYESDNAVIAVTDGNGCPTTHTTQIIFEDCSIEDYAVFIPNVFTPNNDNINDFFAISIMGGYLTEGFIINRWGNIVKEFHPDDLKWDGKTNQGQFVPDGVYTYVFIVSDNNGGKTRYHGFVTMIR
ncbi:gliding motility-associated C-terminal domain-containing protein [Fluviicola chungangensis]|uniref:T9SS type B sorting domain-containing protein n=1 Tax=Fluviicola chungangensis TaxID=2597671 RepID=A0A556MR41_9FLAO|nr:gliding motility-associated C-terminal domain-containing protein [Fluviicola chungangensis]TSJ42390.1 T9SS type B sorting domain-containing protein [Fluviicola chungangensis]